jgi:hypothetical protein
MWSVQIRVYISLEEESKTQALIVRHPRLNMMLRWATMFILRLRLWAISGPAAHVAGRRIAWEEPLPTGFPMSVDAVLRRGCLGILVTAGEDACIVRQLARRGCHGHRVPLGGSR